jgi:hypothetical protein
MMGLASAGGAIVASRRPFKLGAVGGPLSAAQATEAGAYNARRHSCSRWNLRADQGEYARYEDPDLAQLVAMGQQQAGIGADGKLGPQSVAAFKSGIPAAMAAGVSSPLTAIFEAIRLPGGGYPASAGPAGDGSGCGGGGGKPNPDPDPNPDPNPDPDPLPVVVPEGGGIPWPLIIGLAAGAGVLWYLSKKK